MPDNFIPIILGFNGGYATDLPEIARELNYWLKAENATYEVSGAARKVGGAAKINSTAMSGGPNVTGMYDFWRGGGASTFTQKFVAVTADGKVYKEDMDGVMDDITGAATISANAIPVFATAGDLLIILTDKNDTPLKWNQTGNVASLAGSPPAGRGFVYHANRGWIWGANANASRIYFSALGNVEDWTGADTGSIDIQAEDGDRIIGAVSHKEKLFVFKGPNKGSIHVVSGTAPTGADAFNRKVFVKGIALQSHNSIVEFGNDVAFMSRRGIHLLSATQQFADFSEEDVTRFLKKLFRDGINRSVLNQTWALNYADKACVLWTLATAGSSEPNFALGFSYARFKEEGLKPFIWNRDCISAAIRNNPTTRLDEVVFGGTDGFCRRQDVAARNIDSTTAYSFRMQSPKLLLGVQDAVGKQRGDQPFNLERMYMRSVATGNYDITVNLTRDKNPPETYTFNQGLSGFVLDVDSLDTGTIGGGEATQIVYSDPKVVGPARSVQLDILQAGFNEDANILEIGLEVTPVSQAEADVL